MKIILEIPFLFLSNLNVKFDTGDLTWKKYTVGEVILTTRQVELIDKHKFVKRALDKPSEIFIPYIAALKIYVSIMTIQLMRKSLLVALKQDKDSTEVSITYGDFADVFLPNLEINLRDYYSINEYVIKLVEGKPPFYSSIYSLSAVKLEILKIYIKTYQKQDLSIFLSLL